MGGHGGLNILPQKRWNVYNFDNREKVRKDEEAAAHEEQLKQEQSRRRDFELRLEKLRESRNPNPNPNSLNSPNPNHINLFKEEKEEDNTKKRKRDEKEKEKGKAKDKVVVTAEDEKYRLGYGLVGKGVKLPWYMAKARVFDDDEEVKRPEFRADSGSEKKAKSGGKKSIEELREERMRREKKEKERERALIRDSKKGKGVDKGFSRRRM